MALSTKDAIIRFDENEDRINKFVNELGTYVPNSGLPNVETLPSFMQRNSAALNLLASTNVRGSWASSTAYSVWDEVQYSGTWYRCVVAHTSTGTFDSSKWRISQGITAGTLSQSTGASIVGFQQDGSGTITTTVESELKGGKKSVKSFGAVGDGTTDDSAKFTNARAATGGNYYIPDGTYKLTGFDPFQDCFTSGTSVTLIVDGVSYNCSNAIAGALRLTTDSNVLTSLRHAKTGNIIMQWQDGTVGTATYFYRGLAFKTDSHFIQCKPATNNGSTDLLFQRSDLNTDPNGNRFNITFEESTDRLLFSYATSSSGPPDFDSFMQVTGGTSPKLVFPSIAGIFNFGVGTQLRTGATFGLKFLPKSSSAVSIVDSVSGNEIGTVDATNGFIFSGLGWSNPTYGTGSLTYITNGVAIAVAGANSLAFYQNGAEAWRIDTSRNWIPGLDNTYSIGSAAKRPSVIYAATATINTSDERAKTDIEEIPEEWLDAWEDVKFYKFKYKDSVKERGRNARWHVGVIAQRVKEAFENKGIDPFEIGILCYDKWEDQYSDEFEVDEETGNKIPTKKLIKPAGEQYGIRYEEALVLECALLRKKLDSI